MQVLKRIVFIIVILTVWSFSSAPDTGKAEDKIQPHERDLMVTYSIALKSKRKGSGIAETYNGGVKTLFASRGQVRLRMTSLMRMQSVFIFPDESQQKVAIVKESGKNRYKYYLSDEEWASYNQKYEGVTCSHSIEAENIAGYKTQKTVITLKSGKTITAWYTTEIQNTAGALVEPMFACVPGLVLKYQYTQKRGTVICTATEVSHRSIDLSVFAIPGSDVPLKK